MRIRMLIAVAVATLTVPCIAHGTSVVSNYTVYTDKASFLAAVGEVLVEGFESSPESACGDYSNEGNYFQNSSFAITSIPESGGTSFLCINEGGPGLPTEGALFLAAGSYTGNKWTLEFNLFAPSPIYALGFYLMDAAEAGDAIFIGPDGARITIVGCCQPNNSTRFFGIVSTESLLSFSLENSGSADGWGIDEFMYNQYGGAVPEPGTLALLLSGLAGLGVMTRRRKAA